MGARQVIGNITVSNAAQQCLEQSDIRSALICQARGDWGLVSAEQWQANDESLINRNRVQGTHNPSCGRTF